MFQRPCARSDAADLLAAAAVDLAARLRGTAVQDRDPAGSPDVKFEILGHFCWHQWRLHHGSQGAVLTLSPNQRVEGRALPYVWVQGSPHLAWRVARLFEPLTPCRCFFLGVALLHWCARFGYNFQAWGRGGACWVVVPCLWPGVCRSPDPDCCVVWSAG